MHHARVMPTNHLMPAASSLTRTVATHPGLDVPERLSGRTLTSPRASGTPSSSCRRTSSADPDKSGRRHAPHQQHLTPPEAAHDLNTNHPRRPAEQHAVDLVDIKVVRPRCAAGAPP